MNVTLAIRSGQGIDGTAQTYPDVVALPQSQ